MNRRRFGRPNSSMDVTKTSPITKDISTSDKIKDKAIFKLHVHGLEFHGGEELVLNYEFLKNEIIFPQNDAYVMEIYSLNSTDDSRHHLLMDVPSKDELKGKKPIKGKMQLSILKDIAFQFNFQVLQDVIVSFIEKKSVEIDFVEVSLKDQFLSRRDLWYLQHALVGKALYVGKMVRMHGARFQVMELVYENDTVLTGVVTSRTRFVFRSKSSRIFWLIQVSPELWDMGNNGDLYADELMRMVKILFERWQNEHVSHGLTVILFARNYYDTLPPLNSEYYSPSISQDDDGNWFEDFYKVISYGKGGSIDTASMVVTLKEELNAFPHLCCWELINNKILSCKNGNGHPSDAKNGNVLEGINLILNIYEKHYLDRDLNRSGQNLVLFTAGNGIFRINQLLGKMTEQRMMDNGIGFDCISLATPPLESVPRFFMKGFYLNDPIQFGLIQKNQKKINSPDEINKNYSDPYTPVWFSIRFSQYISDRNSFTPLPQCRLFATPTGLCPRPLAFLLTQLKYQCQKLKVTKNHTIPFRINQTQPKNCQFQIQRLRPYNATEEYDDDVFRELRPFIDRSPLLSCGTPPLHSIIAPKRRMKSFALSPELKPGLLKSPLHQFQLPPQARSFPSPRSPHIPSPNRQLTSHGSNRSLLTTYIPSSNSNKRRWSQVYRYEMLNYELDYKSLCIPALLPLTTDYIPSQYELKNNYQESFYTVTLPEKNDMNLLFNNHFELIIEMVAQRFSQDYQLIEFKKTIDTMTYKLSMGHRVHEIEYSESRQEIVVKKFQHHTGISSEPSFVYNYSLYSPLLLKFLPSKQNFHYSHTNNEYPWNYLDNVICGHENLIIEKTKYKRGLYCLLPPNSNNINLNDFIERFNKFIDYLKSKIKSKNKMNIKILLNEKNGRHIQMEDEKIPFIASDAPQQQQWLNIHYDIEWVPNQVFHIEIQWLVCRSALVDDFITGFLRRAKQYNLDIIPMPENCGASTMDVHPLICPIFFPLKNLNHFYIVEKKITMEYQFCMEGIHPIPNHLISSSYYIDTFQSKSNSIKKGYEKRTYRQFIHRSLSCFIRLTDVGVIWISSRRMHSIEMQFLYCQICHLLKMIFIMDEIRKFNNPTTNSILPPAV